MSNLGNPSEKLVNRNSKSEVEVTQQIARITSKLVDRANLLVPIKRLENPKIHANSIIDGDSEIIVTTPAGRVYSPVRQIAVTVKDAKGKEHYHDAAAERNHGVRTQSDDIWTGHSGEFYWADDKGPSQATAHLSQDEVIHGSAQTISVIRDTVANAEIHRQKVV